MKVNPDQLALAIQDPERVAHGTGLLRLLQTRANACTECPRHRTRSMALAVEGAPAPRVVFAIESPDAPADKAGSLWHSPSGRLLREVCDEAGIPAYATTFLSEVPCWHPSAPAQDVREVCGKLWRPLLPHLRPQVIVTLGQHACSGLDPRVSFEDAFRNKPWRQYEGIPWFVTLHPNTILAPANAANAARYRGKLLVDMQAVGAFLRAPRIDNPLPCDSPSGETPACDVG